eukprot:765863-Hanusia_phi.AAC.6
MSPPSGILFERGQVSISEPRGSEDTRKPTRTTVSRATIANPVLPAAMVQPSTGSRFYHFAALRSDSPRY